MNVRLQRISNQVLKVNFWLDNNNNLHFEYYDVLGRAGVEVKFKKHHYLALETWNYLTQYNLPQHAKYSVMYPDEIDGNNMYVFMKLYAPYFAHILSKI